ncbi:MAG: hypothetical protein ACOZF2_05860 [Thermodesulfobacteriota bacterium]
MAESNFNINGLGEEVKENLIEEPLGTILDSTTWKMNAFYDILDEFAFDVEPIQQIITVLKSLLERQEKDLEKIEKVISDSLGKVMILKCREVMEMNDKRYYKDDYFKAVLTPKEPAAAAGEA